MGALPSRLSLCLLTDNISYQDSSVYTLHLTREIKRLGHEVFVACRGGNLLEEFRRNEIPIVLDETLNGGWLSSRGNLVREIRRRRPQILHVQKEELWGLGKSVASRLRLPYLVTVHVPLPSSARLRLSKTWGRAVVAVSETIRENLVNDVGLRKESIRVVLNGIKPPPVPKVEPFERGQEPVVACVGRFEEGRGHPFFLKAAARVLEKRGDVRFAVVGDGPREDALRKHAKELGLLSKVVFFPPEANPYHFLAAVDLFVFPPRQVGLGLTILEAMARGRPVLASAVGGVYYLIQDGETGLLFPPGDSEAISSRILYLLDHRGEARRLGAAARQRAEERFTAERMAEQTVEIYKELLAG